MRIEILTFEGRPNAQTARDRVLAALRLEKVAADLEAIEVITFDTAQEVRFLGSPSVRVNSIDVEARAQKTSATMASCAERTILTAASKELLHRN